MRLINPIRLLTAPFCGAVLVSLLLGGSAVIAQQQRPRLRPLKRDLYAGRFLLIPPDSRPVSILMPRLIARVADHDIVLPPAELLGDVSQPGDPDRIAEWVRQADYSDVDGIIVSIEMLARGGHRGAVVDEKRDRRRLEVLDSVRKNHKAMPVFGIAGDAFSTSKLALDLLSSGTLDYLLICSDRELTGEVEPGGRSIPEVEIVRRGLAGRVTKLNGSDAGAQLLVVRMLNLRFGLVPKIWIGTSPSPHAASLAPMLLSQISVLGGRALPGTPDAASRSDIVLFINAPDTGDDGRRALMETVATTISHGFRVGLVDLVEDSVSREAMFKDIRLRKMLDQMVGFSAATPVDLACGSALAQAAARLVTMKFLRDDIDRLQRAERAQIELMLDRCLSEQSYPAMIQPKLETFLREQVKVDPRRLEGARERAEEFVRVQVATIAEELFNEQYFRNLHSILLTSGERAVFELRGMQRVQVRLAWGTSTDLELRAGVLLVLANIVPVERQGGRAYWDLVYSDQPDERVLRGFDRIPWSSFKIDVEEVGVQINVSRRELGSESFVIQSRRRSKTSRRIEISSDSPRGAFYALSRLEALGREGRLAEDFVLSESPGFAQRGIIEEFQEVGWTHRERLDLIRFLGRMRMNRYYFAPKGDAPDRERWGEAYSEADRERLKELLRVADENFVTLSLGISPGSSINAASESDFNALKAKLDALAALGVRHFTLVLDNVPDALLKSASDSQFKSLAEAQGRLVSRGYEHLQRKWQSVELSVVPAVVANPSSRRVYLRGLGTSIPNEVPVFWTDSVISSPNLSLAQISEWRELVGRRPLIFDNFPLNEGENWRPILGPKVSGGADLAGEAIGLVASPMRQAYVSFLPLVTVAEYSWAPRSYDSARSLERALKLLFDERSAASMRVWCELYHEYRWAKHPFGRLFNKEHGEIDAVQIEQKLKQLEEAVEGLGMARETGLMRGELAGFVKVTRAALWRLVEDPAYERLPDARYRLRPN